MLKTNNEVGFYEALLRFFHVVIKKIRWTHYDTGTKNYKALINLMITRASQLPL